MEPDLSFDPRVGLVVSVAILGGRGQIARTIVPHFPREWRIERFAREAGSDVSAYEAFARGDFDLVVNAAGPGDPAVHRSLGAELFRIAERFDNMALDYLAQHPSCGYVFLSTGAIYGTGYAVPAEDETACAVRVNRLGAEHAYVMSKLAAEAKHRAATGMRIADVRVFGYFTPSIDPTSGFFLAEVFRALNANRPLKTDGQDFCRDFVAPEDLARLITMLFEHGVPPGPYDACSAAPITKFEILDLLAREFGLVVDYGPIPRIPMIKPETLSQTRAARALGYRPELTSADVVARGFRSLIG